MCEWKNAFDVIKILNIRQNVHVYCPLRDIRQRYLFSLDLVVHFELFGTFYYSIHWNRNYLLIGCFNQEIRLIFLKDYFEKRVWTNGIINKRQLKTEIPTRISDSCVICCKMYLLNIECLSWKCKETTIESRKKTHRLLQLREKKQINTQDK